MKLKILAAIYEDGCAIVRDSESRGIFLLRPPYDLASRIVMNPRDAQEAVAKHGFNADDVEFSDYSSLIDHLETSLRESREKSGNPICEEPPLAEAIAIAPIEIISDFLTRAENELIKQKKWDQAERLLLNILMTRTEGEIKSKAMAVFQRLGDAKKRSESWRPADVRFAGVESDECKRITRVIQQRRCILEPSP